MAQNSTAPTSPRRSQEEEMTLMSLLDLVREELWDEASRRILSGPDSVFVTNEATNHRTALHVLCRTFNIHDDDDDDDHDSSNERDETGLEADHQDDDDDDSGDERDEPALEASGGNDVDDGMQRQQQEQQQQRPGKTMVPTPSRGDSSNSDREDGSATIDRIVEVARLIIETSHTYAEPVVLPEPQQSPQSTTENGEDVTSMKFALHRNVLTVKDYMGNTPLHCVCGCSASPKLIQLILESTDDYYRTPDGGSGDDRTSTLYAHRRRPTARELITSQNVHGCTPLHFIAENNCSYKAAKLIMKFCSSDYNVTRPNATIEEGLESENNNPSLTGPPRSLYSQELLVNEISTMTISHDTNSYPYLTTPALVPPSLIQDEDGDTPLHFACCAGASPRRLDLLLDNGPTAVFVPNQEGHLPIDDLLIWFFDTYEEEYATIESSASTSDIFKDELTEESWKLFKIHLWNRVEPLLRTTFRLDTMNTHCSFRPVHAACAVPTFPAFILKLAIKLFPHQLLEKDELGMSPLHVAAAAAAKPFNSTTTFTEQQYFPATDTYDELARWETPEESSSLIEYVLNANTTVAKVWANDGRLPLHLAIENSKGLNDIKALMSAAPEALRMRDVVTKLYPFMLAAVNDSNDLDVVYYLLLSNPERI